MNGLILVAGRSGQVARALTRLAGERRVPLLALGRPALDITDAESVERVMEEHRPALLVNAAAWTAVDAAETEEAAAFAANAEGPCHLARTAAAAGIPFIHFSSDYVYDGSGSQPRTESELVAPLSAYGRLKAAGDAAALAEHGDGTVILRTSWVHDPEGDNFVRTVLRLARERDLIPVVGDQRGAPTAASSLAAAILAIARQIEEDGLEGRTGIFHAADSGQASRAEVARFAIAEAERLGLRSARVEEIATADRPSAAPRPLNSRLDCTRLRDAWGISMPDWRIGVARTVRWLAKAEEMPA